MYKEKQVYMLSGLPKAGDSFGVRKRLNFQCFFRCFSNIYHGCSLKHILSVFDDNTDCNSQCDVTFFLVTRALLKLSLVSCNVNIKMAVLYDRLS